jgi:superfamily I DNA and/or RNA helicase
VRLARACLTTKISTCSDVMSLQARDFSTSAYQAGPTQQHEIEAVYVAALVEALATTHPTLTDANIAKDQIFVCTPHNAQKAAIKRALTIRNRAGWCDIVDTTERMQGQERDVVIICLSVFTPEQVAREVEFLLSKQRLNVAISRAKKTCILVYADAVVALNPAVIGSPTANEAHEHLLAFIAAAEAAGASCKVSVAE